MFKWLSKFLSSKTESEIIKEKEEEVKEIIKNGITISITGPSYDHEIPEYTTPNWCDTSSSVQIGFQASVLNYDETNKKPEPWQEANNRIISNLQPQEIQFFKTLINKTVNANIVGSYEVSQYTDDRFEIFFSGNNLKRYIVSSVKLRLYPPEYACIKKGNKKATRVFKILQDANNFISSHKNYIIVERCGESKHYLSYKHRINSNPITLKNLSFDEYYNAIDHIITYLKYLYTLSANKKRNAKKEIK